MSGRRAVVAVSVGTAAAAVAAIAAAPRAREPQRHPSPASEPAVRVAALPGMPNPALHVARPRLLANRDVSLWAPVQARAIAVTRAGGGEAVAVLPLRTPEGTTNIVSVLKVVEVRGEAWARVRLAGRTGATTGWVRRDLLGPLHAVGTRLQIDLETLRLTLYVDGRAEFRAPIGAGAAATPTPAGTFYVRDKLTRYDSAFYGPVAFGTSATSRVLTDWPAGGYIGIHGTNAPQEIPGRVSHGCIRLRNADLVQLARLLPIGTPITIR